MSHEVMHASVDHVRILYSLNQLNKPLSRTRTISSRRVGLSPLRATDPHEAHAVRSRGIQRSLSYRACAQADKCRHGRIRCSSISTKLRSLVHSRPDSVRHTRFCNQHPHTGPQYVAETNKCKLTVNMHILCCRLLFTCRP